MLSLELALFSVMANATIFHQLIGQQHFKPLLGNTGKDQKCLSSRDVRFDVLHWRKTRNRYKKENCYVAPKTQSSRNREKLERKRLGEGRISRVQQISFEIVRKLNCRQ